MDSAGVFFFKLMVLMAISPVWFPVIKAIWQEMNIALAEEGGVLGRAPSPTELEKMKRERAWRPDPMVHEPWPAAGQRGALGNRKQQTPYDPAVEQARSVAKGAHQAKSSPRRGL